SSWNLLSYESGGKYYINGTTWDPYCNNQGGLSHLDWFYDAYLSGWWEDDDGVQTYPNYRNMTEFYYDVMRQDIEIPAPAVASGGSTVKIMDNTTSRHNTTIPYYTAGYIFQQRWTPYVKVFAPVLGLNATHIVVDWNTTNAHTQFWNLNIKHGEFDFNETDSWDYFTELGDWSFVDDYEAGYWYSPDIDYNLGNRDHMVLSFDYTGDDVDDFGLGALAHGWDGIFGTGIVDGIGLGGRTAALVYDTDAHGTFVAGQIASRGVLEYPIGLNGTMERIYGVANASTIIAVPALGGGSFFGASLWEAGFDLNYTSGYFEWNPMSNHSCAVSSNSWGWVGTDIMNNELQPLYALMYTAISTPGFFDSVDGHDYPGMLFAFSAGNSGPSYGTASPPNAPQILTVGGSTSYHTFQDSYGPGQGYDQIFESGSRGPTLTGYPKPDIVAPGRNVYGLQPGEEYMLNYLGGASWPSAIYAGTSMACPHVAGAIAILVEAATNNSRTLRPDEIKVILQNTAMDLGLDALTQGFGRVDIKAAVEWIEGVGSEVVFSNTGGIYADVVADAWAKWMTPYKGDALMNNDSLDYPTTFADGSLYYGIVSPGDLVNVTMDGELANGTAIHEPDFNWTSQDFEAQYVYNYVWNTYTYNETVSMGHDIIRGGYYDLSNVMGGDYGTFTSATYATILIGASSDDVNSGDLWAFVFDWDDSTNNGVPDYYNTSTEAGDELTRYAFGGDGHDIKIDIHHPTAISNLENGDEGLIVMVHDEGVWGWPTVEEGDGNDLNVTIIVWGLGGDNGEILVADNTDGGLWANLTVPAGAEPGVHQGYLLADTDHRIPYTYFVSYDVDTSKGEEHIVADGYGDVLTPYEHGSALSMEDSYYGDGSGDHKVFHIHVSNSSAMYLGAKIDWTEDETYFDISISDVYGESLAISYDANKLSYSSASVIADMDGGTDFYVFVYAHDLWHELPCNFTLIVMAWEELPAPTLAFNWYSRDAPARTSITTGGVAEGDHVVMNATWTDAPLTNMPDYGITTLELKILYGSLVQKSGTLMIPDGAYDPFAGGPLHLDEFDWEYIPNISAGDAVRISVSFTNGDCDIFVYWADTDNSTWSAATDLADGAMGTGANP
ncbi:MAG: S8 family serine peptidase, partial [Candidatus Thorarchaeota archaeon]|nr:S8 family serine peptidase [Candidatus Thorarchaeota archaeon]